MEQNAETSLALRRCTEYMQHLKNEFGAEGATRQFLNEVKDRTSSADCDTIRKRYLIMLNCCINMIADPGNSIEARLAIRVIHDPVALGFMDDMDMEVKE